MPELGAIHEDVQFDWLAASDLSAELRATAVVLETQLVDRDVARRDARLWWEGRYGDEFDQRVATCVADAGRFVLSLRDAADRLDELARLARQEQDRRTQAREWEASQDDGGGGGLMGTLGDAVDTVDDFLTGEDDLPPPPPPVEPPLIPLYDPGPTVREVSLPPLAPSGSGVGVPASGFVGGGGGVSSGEPAALDAWVTSSRGLDESVLTRKGTLDGLHGDFTATLGWGSFDASSLLGGMGTWLTWNGTDALWVATIAQAFRHAGTGTVSDAVIAAQVDAAGLDGTRTAVTYDSPAAWGEPSTSGYADDPVNTASGNFVEAEVDLEVGGLARLLRFARTYNSRSDRVGPFGPGWSSWASVRLRAEPDGAHWVGPDGQEVVVPRSSAGYPRVVGLAGLVAPEGDGLTLAALDGRSRLVFDAAGRLRWADAGPGTEVRFVHDGDRLIELRHEGGRSVRLEWEGDQVVAVRCSDGRSVTYAYDEGRLVSASGGARGLRGYEVDDRGRVVAVTDADGVVEVRNRYDDDGRVVEQQSPFGRRSRYRYLGGRVTVVDDGDAGGPANSYVHDDRGRLVGAIDGHGHELRKAYDRWGNPVRVTERDGTTTLLEWDDRSRLVRREAADGSWFAFDHDEQGRLLAAAASTGATTRFRYEGAERTPAEVVDPEGGVTRLDAHDGLVHRLVDPDGVELRFGFDAHGELTSITDGLGNTATFERDEAGRVTAAVSPTGHRTEQAYDPAGRIVARRDGADGAEWGYEWSAAGRLRAVVDPLGARRELRYGSHGEAEQVVDELGHATTRRFDPLGNLVGVVLPGGAKWAFEYDGLCRLTGVGDPAGATWLREYDVAGRLVGTVDPVGARRGVALDNVGRIAAVDDGLTSVAFAYDPLGRAAAHRRPDGTEARATYDRCGRVTSVTDPDGGVTRYEHTPAGRLAAVASPLGHTTRCEYDAAGSRIAVVDPSGQRWVQRHDGDGRVTQVVAPAGETVRFRYGGGGRLVARVSSAGGTTRYEHDLVGRPVAVSDPTGGVTRFTWDAAGRLASATDPLGGVTRYEHDARGFLRTVVDPLGGRVEHRYDAVGRLVERRDQLGRRTRWEHDPAGRLLRRTLPGGCGDVRWWYDGSGRTRAIGVGDAERVRFSRDLLGRLVVVEEPGFRHELEWSATGRLVARRRNGLGLTWRYDLDGRRVAVGYPDGSETTFTHDAAGQVVAAAHPALGPVELEHDEAGRVVRRGSERWQYRDGVLVSHESAGRVTSLERDAAGRVVAATVAGGARTTYAYDAAGQLVAAGAWTFTYDPAGRLVAESGPAGERTYAYDAAHQLKTCRYDAAGRRVDGHEWDWLGHLSRSGDTSLHVDALGDLAEVDGMPLLWDPTSPVPGLRWLDGTKVLGADEAWATVGRDGQADWLTHDWQGSVVGPTSDPWGPAAASSLGLGYRGELEIDGLVWLRNRAYDPATRAFLSPDPLPGVPGRPYAAYPYHYAGNDPVGAVDPFGLRPMTEADLAAYREASASGGLLDPVTGWVADNWEYLAAGAMIVAGGALLFTGAGIVLGGALLAGGLSMGSQRLVTGQVDWTQVGVDMVIGGLSAGAGSWASGLTSTGAATWSTLSRTALQVGVSTTVDVSGGMAARQLTNQDPFDPQALALDTLTGASTGGLDAVGTALHSRPHIAPRTVTYGPTSKPSYLGETGAFGDIRILPDLPPDVAAETLRHERVHSAFSPRRGTHLDVARARLAHGLSEHSHIYTYVEEAVAETYATRSLRDGLTYPFREEYVTPVHLAVEGAGAAGVGAAGYVGHEALTED